MHRRNATRTLMALGAALAWPMSARAHHGWSSFDQTKPIWLQGRASQLRWRNPHAELKLTLDAGLKLPADLAQRKLPAQQATVDGAALLAAARVPTRADKVWDVELAPLTRMQAWGVPEISEGQAIGVLGFTFAGEKGDPVLRVEYLFLGEKVYGLRSGPA